MGLSIPSVGDSDYPTSVSTTTTLIDAHNHTSGKGVQVPTGGIADSAVTTAKIATDAVTTAKIADANVTTAKILDANVTQAKLGVAPISTLSLGNGINSANANTLALTASYQDFPAGLAGSWAPTLNSRPVLLRVSFTILNSDAGQRTVFVQLLRNATVIRHYTSLLGPDGASDLAGYRKIEDTVLDAGGSGAVTYKLQARFVSGTLVNILSPGSIIMATAGLSLFQSSLTEANTTTSSIRCLEGVEL